MKQGDEVVHIKHGKGVITQGPDSEGRCKVKFGKPIKYGIREIIAHVGLLKNPYSLY